MNPSDPYQEQSDRQLLVELRRRVGWLNVLVVILILAVVMLASSVYGYLLNFFGSDAQLHVSATIVAAVLGFLFGWIARGKR